MKTKSYSQSAPNLDPLLIAKYKTLISYHSNHSQLPLHLPFMPSQILASPSGCHLAPLFCLLTFLVAIIRKHHKDNKPK
jgi:hypothetical protein